MTRYNIENVKISNSEFDKLKPAIKIAIKVTLRLPSNMMDNSNDKLTSI